MKKFLLTFSLAAMLFSAKGQIVITGAMFDPQGTDAPSTTTQIPNGPLNTYHKGGYEYVQLMATEKLVEGSRFCLVRANTNSSTTGADANGWASAGSAKTFKFNIVIPVGQEIQKGEFFYVGGPEKTAGGFLATGNVYYPVLDLSGKKWFTIAYSNGTTTAVGDDGIGLGNTGLFGNGSIAVNPTNNPLGIAVFAGTTIDKNSVPIDAIFVGQTSPGQNSGDPRVANLSPANISSVYYNDGSNINGYRVPKTEYYVSGYFADGNTIVGANGNNHVFQWQPSENVAWFLKLGGVYNIDDKVWTTPRSGNYLQLVPPTAFGTFADRTSFATLAMIEGSAAGYNGVSIAPTILISPLPVSLTNFTAKANKQGTVNLAWSTSSEQNNSHFEVARSADGKTFSKIGQVTGANNSSTVKNYSYVDENPVAGVNYYQLKQVDFDGTSSLSKVAFVKVGLGTNDLTVGVSANRTSLTANYNASVNGKATFAVYTVAGAKVTSVEQNVTAGNNQVSLQVSLGNSLHILKVTQGSQSISVKF